MADDQEFRYDVFVLRRPAPLGVLRALDKVCRPLAMWLYFSTRLGRPRMLQFTKTATREWAMDNAQRIANRFPCALVLVEVRDDEPRIIMRMVTDDSFQGFRAEIENAVEAVIHPDER